MTVMNQLKLWLIPPIGYLALRALGWTLRLRTLHGERPQAFWDSGRPVILAFWHGRQVMLPMGYHGGRLAILISEHRDGELVARIMQRFGFETVRGSTTRGGARALRQLVRLGRDGVGLAVTPDGPKGPRCVAQAGVVELAKLTGLPILPFTFSASKKNSSAVGIASKSRYHAARPAMPGATRSSCRLTPTSRSVRRSGWRWRRRSTGSAMRRIAR